MVITFANMPHHEEMEPEETRPINRAPSGGMGVTNLPINFLIHNCFCLKQKQGQNGTEIEGKAIQGLAQRWPPNPDAITDAMLCLQTGA